MYHHLKANLIIGRRVRTLRKQRGLTQANVAKQLHLHRETLSVIESGQQTLTVPQLAILTRIFQIPYPDAILNGLPTH